MPSLLTTIRRMLNVQNGRPKTYVESGATKERFFTERVRSQEIMKKYETIYNQGGVITEAINAYPMFITTNGWQLEGPDASVAVVEDVLNKLDFDAIMWDSITDALVYGDAFQEITTHRDGSVADIVPRHAPAFEILHDAHGKLYGYQQVTMTHGIEKKVPLKPSQIVHLQLWKLGGSMYGHSLLHRAYDEIIRDTRTAEATSVAVHRHGFKKYHVKVGLEGEIIPQEVLDDINKEFEELDTKNDFVTPHDVEILNIDEGGLEKIDLYNDISLMRLATALGVPEEVLGMRRGSTDATAVTRVSTFFKKISSMQKRVARCYTLAIIDKIVEPGTVKIVFNEVDPEDDTKKADWIATILKATPDPFAILPQEWVQTQFNIIESARKKEKKTDPVKEPSE